MPSLSRSVNINAPSDLVWTILVKHLEHPEIPFTYEGRSPRIMPKTGIPLTEQRKGVGVKTRWSYTFRGKEYVWEDVTKLWEEGRRIAWSATSGMRMNDYFEISPTNTHVLLIYHSEYKAPYGLLGAINERLFYRAAIIEHLDWILQVIKRNAERLATIQSRVE